MIRIVNILNDTFLSLKKMICQEIKEYLKYVLKITTYIYIYKWWERRHCEHYYETSEHEKYQHISHTKFSMQ